jgi:hypothetical protein
MANDFKTLSLEERWKNSVHNRQPQPTQPVNQGGVAVPLPQRPETQQSIQLKLTGQSLITNNLPSAIPSEVTPLESYERPFVNTKYRTAISLTDRLKQSTNLGSTNHLAQYFLSDQYTDYIKVIPFGTFNHTSTINLDDNTFTPTQGGLDASPFLFDSLFFQGVVVKNGEIVSISNTTSPTTNIINSQGAILVNGNYTSFTNVEPSIPTSQLQQDLNVQVSNPTDANAIGFSQGLVQTSNGEMGSITTIDDPNYTPTQGGTSVLPFTYEPNRTPVDPSVLRYAADRALAYFTPRIKHGSVYVEPLPDYYGRSANPGRGYISRASF